MLQLKNGSPFAAHIAVLPDPDGIDTLYVTIKATFSLGAKVELVDPQPPHQNPQCAALDQQGEQGETSSQNGNQPLRLIGQPGIFRYRQRQRQCHSAAQAAPQHHQL